MWNDAENFLKKDKHIGSLVKKWGKCEIKPTKKEFYLEDLVDAIVGQQLSGAAAKTIFGRVKLLLGKITPKNILKAKDQKLRSAGLSRQKIGYIRDLAKKIETGQLEIEKLGKLTNEAVVEELVVVRGIGRWTAEMFLMFSLARPDVFPVEDLGIKKAYEKVFKKRFDKTKASRFAEKHWAPYKTVASWYLWRSLENR